MEGKTNGREERQQRRKERYTRNEKEKEGVPRKRHGASDTDLVERGSTTL